MKVEDMAGLYAQFAKIEEKFYTKLEQENEEAFTKMGTTKGDEVEFPKFPKVLEGFAENSCSSWMTGDPSTNCGKSWLVAGFKLFHGQLTKELATTKMLEKLLLILMFPVLLAMSWHFYSYNYEKFDKFIQFAELLVKFFGLFILVKLLTVAKALEFLSWKVVGHFAKLEYTLLCAGGNINKLLSMCASKLGFLELRAQEERSDEMDTGRGITNYLVESIENSIEYLKEGVRRKAQSWVESRKARRDLAPEEFEANWQQLKTVAFQHAKARFEDLKSWSFQAGEFQDVEVMEQHIAKLQEVARNPTEQLSQY